MRSRGFSLRLSANAAHFYDLVQTILYSTNTMQRLLTFCLLLTAVAAQNGYNYNKPGKPFSQNPSNQISTSGYNPSTTPSYQAPQNNQYQNTGLADTGYQSGQPSYPTSQAPGQNFQPANTPSVTNSYSAPSVPSASPAYGPPKQQQTGFQTPPPAYQGQQFTALTGQNQGTQGQQYPSQYNPQDNSFGAHSSNDGSYEGGDYSAIPGEPDKDYPILTEIPQTSFRCDAQPYPGYYADVETRCQVFHVCANNRTFDFLCPNGTIFSQQVFVCVWWNQFDCNSAPSYYELNANLYDYSKNGAQNTYSSGTNLNHGLSNYPDTTGIQGPTANYPYNPQITGTNIGSPTGSSPGYQGAEPSTGTSSNYDGTSGNSLNYQSNPSSQGESAGYPNIQAGSYSGSQSQTDYPDSSIKGYPSGKPNGPSFPTGNSYNQGDNAETQNPPNREYLPPKN